MQLSLYASSSCTPYWEQTSIFLTGTFVWECERWLDARKTGYESEDAYCCVFMQWLFWSSKHVKKLLHLRCRRILRVCFKLRPYSIKHLIHHIVTASIILLVSHWCSSLMDYLTVMRPHLIVWHEAKLTKVQCQHHLVLTKSVYTSIAWALHTLIGWSRESTVDKFLSLVHPFHCVSSTFLPTTVDPPTALINHSRSK
jgi:hypothetical protein